MIGIKTECNTSILKTQRFPSPPQNAFRWDRGRFVSASEYDWSNEETSPLVAPLNAPALGGGEWTIESVKSAANLAQYWFEVRNAASVAALLRPMTSPEEYCSRPLPPFERLEFYEGLWKELIEKLCSYSALVDGWDGYSAPPPLRTAVETVHGFFCALRHSNFRPTKVSPSVVGGIGVTFRKGQRKSYVEFYNNGTLHALFSDGESDPRTCQVQPTPAGYGRLIMEIQEYLNA